MTTGAFGKDRNAISCTACGAANSPGSRFCERCGTRLPQPPGGNQPTRAMPSPRPATSAVSPAADMVPTPEEAAQESPDRDEAPRPPAASDSPTVTIDLVPTRESTRNAPTETFELPPIARPAGETPATTPATTDAAPPSNDQPTQIGSGWNYRSWTPPPGGAAPSPEQGNEPPVPVPPRESDPIPTTPPAEVTRVTRFTAGAPQERVSAPEEPPFGTSTTVPPTAPAGSGTTAGIGQPYSGGTPGYGAPPPTGYMANAGQYPAPASRSNNRTLWIILGVVGGLTMLCIIICLLVVVVAAVGASSTTGVATSVATATRR